MLSHMGVFLTTQEFRTVYNTFDANKDGVVTWMEFFGALKVRAKPVTAAERHV